ncbi:MAG: hypothetical protein QF535_19710 [Anaerolineales bacterium]|nr:hypothetical protein [Anaerolineales bacterium]
MEVLQAAHELPKNPVLQAEQVVPSCEQAVHSAMEVLQATHELPKNPVLQVEQVVPSCEQAVHSAMDVLQAAHEFPKNPVPHYVHVEASEQVTQLFSEVETHAFVLRQNPEEQVLHVVPSMLQSAQSAIDVLQASQVLPLHHSVPDVHAGLH